MENAIHHGRGETEKVICVTVSAFLREDRIIFEVTDNGVGIDAERLQNVNIGNCRRDDGGYGLANVNKRIKLYCGKMFGIVVLSELNKGTKAIVTLPLEIH